MPADLPAPLLQLEWCAPFAGPVRAALHDLKYAGERRLARPLGQAVARRWRRVGEGATLVVPVPVHAERERRRGYDQAALIAAVAAAELGLPCVRALERERATTAQFELGREDRAANVAGAFRAARTGSGRLAGRRSVAGAGSCWSTMSSRPARPWPHAPRPSSAPARWASRRSPSPGAMRVGVSADAIAR